MSQATEITSALPSSETSRFIVEGIQPQWVVEPNDAEEIGDLLRLARDRSWGVIPFGSGTRQGIGNLPIRFDAALSLRKFNRIPEYEPQDLVVKVESGCRLIDLQDKLSQDNLFLPIDPPCDSGTVGGIVASNTSGPLRLAHGTIRDFLLGIGVVQPTGTKTKFGARVVKNVTGYDMCKLYAGSFGTLGVFTDFYFKLKPLPPSQATVLGVMKELSTAREALMKLRESPLSPLAVEFMNPEAARVLSRSLPFVWNDRGYSLAVLFGEVERAVRWQVEELKRLWEPLGLVELNLSESAEQKALWQVLREDGPFTEGFPGSTLKLKINSLPSQLSELVQQLDLLKTKLNGGVLIKSHAASGVTQAYLRLSDSPAEQQEIARGIERLRNFLKPFRGSVVVELAPLALKKIIDVWGCDSKDRLLMQRIREKYDSPGILNPGRFVV
jgi:glycolate oxidase FAD binding subunit